MRGLSIAGANASWPSSASAGLIRLPSRRQLHLSDRLLAPSPLSTMAEQFAPRTMKRKNVKGLALTPAAPKPPPTAETSHPELDTVNEDPKTAQLEIGIEYKLDLRSEDLEVLKELGSGNGGTVSKVRHITTNTIMARKVKAHNPTCASWMLMLLGYPCGSQEGNA